MVQGQLGLDRTGFLEWVQAQPAPPVDYAVLFAAIALMRPAVYFTAGPLGAHAGALMGSAEEEEPDVVKEADAELEALKNSQADVLDDSEDEEQDEDAGDNDDDTG